MVLQIPPIVNRYKYPLLVLVRNCLHKRYDIEPELLPKINPRHVENFTFKI